MLTGCIPIKRQRRMASYQLPWNENYKNKVKTNAQKSRSFKYTSSLDTKYETRGRSVLFTASCAGV